jgi:hypothetical protein
MVTVSSGSAEKGTFILEVGNSLPSNRAVSSIGSFVASSFVGDRSLTAAVPF